MNNFVKIIIALVVVTSIISCKNKREPQVQYMPDMYVSVPYEANSVNAVYGNDGMTNRTPVEGTIGREQRDLPFEYKNTNEGYDLAKAELKSPLKTTKENLENGKKMFTIYCTICHGKKGDGNGVLSQRDKFNGIPNYKDINITEGSIYYVIMYGRNLMGSHSSQLTTKERWEVVQYVEKLKQDLK